MKIKATIRDVFNQGWLLDIVLVVLFFLSVYAIIVIGLELPSKISVPYGIVDANKLNVILINLSYSYLAGCIFYFFTSYLPKYKSKKDIVAGIKVRMGAIDRVIFDLIYILSYKNDVVKKTYSATMNCILSSEEQFVSFCKSFDWNAYTKYHEVLSDGTKQKYLWVIKEQHLRLQQAMTNFITTYKEYLTAEQLSKCEGIRASFLMYRLSMTPSANNYVYSQKAMEETAKDIYSEFMEIWSLKRSIDSRLANWHNWIDQEI